MLWLRDLGAIVEGRHGTWYFALMVLALSAASNLAQYLITGSPKFGGMSGVVYGLLGYVWIRGKFDPLSGLFLHQVTVIFMLIWFAAGFAGVVGNMANWAHAGGLLLGMAWGYISAQQRR
jgi:GlpG protein